MSSRHQKPGSGNTRRVLLTVAIIVGALVLMVLPWVFLFHSPEQFAGWAASGVVLAVALHLFLSSRKRRQALRDMLEEEEGDDPADPLEGPGENV